LEQVSRIIFSRKYIIFIQFFWFLLIGQVTLKKPDRKSVQIFSTQTTEPVWFVIKTMVTTVAKRRTPSRALSDGDQQQIESSGQN
jgi:hypothetical protein